MREEIERMRRFWEESYNSEKTNMQIERQFIPKRLKIRLVSEKH